MCMDLRKKTTSSLLTSNQTINLVTRIVSIVSQLVSSRPEYYVAHLPNNVCEGGKLLANTLWMKHNVKKQPYMVVLQQSSWLSGAEGYLNHMCMASCVGYIDTHGLGVWLMHTSIAQCNILYNITTGLPEPLWHFVAASYLFLSSRLQKV